MSLVGPGNKQLELWPNPYFRQFFVGSEFSFELFVYASDTLLRRLLDMNLLKKLEQINAGLHKIGVILFGGGVFHGIETGAIVTTVLSCIKDHF